MVMLQFMKGSFTTLQYLFTENKSAMKFFYLYQTHIKGRLRRFSGAEVITSKAPKDDLVCKEETYLIRLSILPLTRLSLSSNAACL